MYISNVAVQAKAHTAGHGLGGPWGWVLSSLCPSSTYLLREARPYTDALTVLSSENPFPSPLSQHHIDPSIDEDSHSKGQIEGHH